ncbi:MAG: guanylate cyclase [Eggerthellaceae bacterium]|nr:guanylate cyclase [Eggerthellaceae bacterium]
MGIILRLATSVPLIIILVIAAIVIYWVVTWRHSPERAKEILILVFTVITIIITVFFALVCLYALFEFNIAVFELSAGGLIVGVAGLVITRICNYRFHKHHPHYKRKPMRARVKHRWPWQRWPWCR